MTYNVMFYGYIPEKAVSTKKSNLEFWAPLTWDFCCLPLNLDPKKSFYDSPHLEF